MAQLSAADVQTKTGTPNFLASLQANLSLGNASNGLFANLLSQVKTMEATAPAPQDTASSANTVAPDANSGASAPPANDASSLQGLLQRMQQDADNLKAIRQQEQHNQDAQNANSTQNNTTASPATTTVPTTDAPRPLAKAEAKGKADATNGKTTQTASSLSMQIATTDAAAQGLDPALAQTATPATTAAATPTATDGTAKDSATTDSKDTTSNAQNILADLIHTEQAALMLLKHMAQNQNDATQATPTTQTAGTAAANLAATDKAATLLDPSAPQTSGKHDLLAQQAAANTTDAATTGWDLTAQGLKAAAPDTLAAPASVQDGTKGTAAPTTKAANDSFDFLNLFDPNKAAASVVAVPNASATALTTAATQNATTADTLQLDGAASRGNASLMRTDGTATPTTLTDSAAHPVGSYDFASQLSATRATKGGTAGLPTAIEQVAIQLHKQVKDGNDEMTLQLRPQELGRVDIKLEFSSDNKVQATVTADNQATLDLMSKDQGNLQRALQDAGLNVDSNSLQFNLRDNGQQNAFTQGQNSGSQSGSTANTSILAPTSGEDLADTTSEMLYLTPGRVNLKV